MRGITAGLAGIALAALAGCSTARPQYDPVPPSATTANKIIKVKPLQPCKSKSVIFPVPCVFDGEGKDHTFWAVGTGQDNKFITATVAEAQQEWADPTQWLSIDAETGRLLQGYGEADRDYTQCGTRTFYGTNSPSIIACPDGHLEIS